MAQTLNSENTSVNGAEEKLDKFRHVKATHLRRTNTEKSLSKSLTVDSSLDELEKNVKALHS